MKKLLFALVSIMFLASCVPQNTPVDFTTPSPAQGAVTTAAFSTNSPSKSQSPAALSKGESVSETFNTDDLKKLFTLSSEELCTTLGSGFDNSNFDDLEGTIIYSNLGASFEYSFNSDDKSIILNYEQSEDEPAMVLQRIVLSSFDFRGLNPTSDFEDVINTLGSSKLLVLHNEKGYYYALRYSIDSLIFEFSSLNKKGSEGLSLSIIQSYDSQIFYTSRGEGYSVSKTLTTGDIKQFLGLAPEGLDSIFGNGSTSFNEDTGLYYIYFDYLGLHFAYSLGEAEQGEEYAIYPVLPLECVWVDDFEYRGLNKNSNFKDVMQVLGKGKIIELSEEDSIYYAIEYKIDGMIFKFSGSDKKASDGVLLCIKSN